LLKLRSKCELKIRTFYSKFWKQLLIIFFSVAYLPIIYKVPIGYDQGIFAYIGEVIKRGGNPYQDAWDFKGPLLYYLNALGLGLFDDLRGIFILELVWNCTFIFISLRLIQKSRINFNFFYCFSTGVISYILVMMGGNLTETWGFGPQILSYSIVWSIVNTDKNLLKTKLLLFYNLAQSLNFFVCFQLRPNNAMGIGIAWLITSIISIKILKLGSRRIIQINFTFILALFISSLLFIYNRGYLKSYLYQAFQFNFDYINQFTLSERLNNAFFLLTKTYKLPIVTLMLLLIFVVVVGNRKLLHLKSGMVFVLIFITDLLSIIVSGMPWLHYLVLIIPSSIFLTYSIMSVKYFEKEIFQSMVQRLVLTLLILVFTFMALNSRWYVEFTKESFQNKDSTLYLASKFILENTDTSDRLYVWGKPPIYHLKPFRYSASNVTYIYPMLVNNDKQDKYIREINQDFIAYKPRYILQANRYCFEWKKCSNRYPISLEPTISYIKNTYEPVLSINQELTIWKLKS
jgi:hypothetical protein